MLYLFNLFSLLQCCLLQLQLYTTLLYSNSLSIWYSGHSDHCSCSPYQVWVVIIVFVPSASLYSWMIIALVPSASWYSWMIIALVLSASWYSWMIIALVPSASWYSWMIITLVLLPYSILWWWLFVLVPFTSNRICGGDHYCCSMFQLIARSGA